MNYLVNEEPFTADDPKAINEQLSSLLSKCIARFKGKTWREARVAAAKALTMFIDAKLTSGEIRMNPAVVDVRRDLSNPENWIIGPHPENPSVVFFKYVPPGSRAEA